MGGKFYSTNVERIPTSGDQTICLPKWQYGHLSTLGDSSMDGTTKNVTKLWYSCATLFGIKDTRNKNENLVETTRVLAANSRSKLSANSLFRVGIKIQNVVYLSKTNSDHDVFLVRPKGD